MAITFTSNPASDATFADLFTDDSTSTTWYRVWTEDADGNGGYVDTSAFNDSAAGWIEASDLDSLTADYAQADDTVLWVQTWNATDGSGAWVSGNVDFSAIDAATVTTEVTGETTWDQLFVDANVSAGTWYRLWTGDASTGSYVDTSDYNTYGNGWIEASDLASIAYTPGNTGTSEEVWVQAYVDGVTYPWESWTVSNQSEIGNTFNLTENIETVQGTSGDDTFNGYTTFSVVGQTNTLQSGDVVNGGAGSDILIAESTGGTIAATINDVETLQLTSYAATTIEGANVTGLETLDFKYSVSASTVRNLSNLVDVSVQNQTGANNVTIGYTDTALTGTNTQNLTLNNVTMQAAGGLILFEDNNGAGSLEALNIMVTGSSNIAGINDLSILGPGGTATDVLANVETVTVNATATASLGTISTPGMTLFDASGSTAAVIANVSEATGNDLTIKGGDGDDVISFVTAANLNTNDTIDLGGGTNTLAITGTVNGAAYNVSNVQNLQITTDAAPTTVNAEAFGTGVTTIEFVSAADVHTGIVNNVADGSTISAKDNIGAVDTLAALTINGKNTSGTTDAVTVNLYSSDAGTPSAPNTFTVTTLTAAQYENIALVSQGADNTQNTITTLTATAQETVTISGDKKLTISNNLSAKTVDASESTGGVDVGLAGTAVSGGKQSVTGGDGDDTFNIEVSVMDKNVTVDAGDGTDTLALTKTAAGNIDLTGVANAELISGMSNFENLSFGGETLLIDDATLNRFTDSTINVVEKGAAATALDASLVLGSSSVINVDASKMTGGGFTYSLSNGSDNFVGSAQVDAVAVTNAAYISDDDTLNGGAGNNNTLTFNTAGATKAVIASTQLANVSNFDTWNITDTTAAANEFELTVSNTIAAQNINNTNSVLTIVATTNDDDKITIDASDVGSAYVLNVATGTGAGTAAAQTVKLGAGNDTVLINSAVAGATINTITLGDGKDVAEFAVNTAKAAALAGNALLSNNTITDFNFGTKTGSTANVDKLDFGAESIVAVADAAGGIYTVGSGAGDYQVVVLNDVSYDTQQAVDTAVKAACTGNTAGDNVVVIWQDSLGRVQVGVDLDATDDTAGTFATTGVLTHAVLDGVTITGVASTIDLGDLILV